MNILITGGAGFFGSKLTEILLKRGDKVTVYDNLIFGSDGYQNFIDNPNYTLVVGDVMNQELLQYSVMKNEVIVHMAAFVGEPVCRTHKEVVLEVNTESVKFLSDLCYKENKKLIYLSTCSNYGKNTEIVNENSSLNPLGLYSDSKVKAENYIIENRKSFLILRCSTLFGVSHRMRYDLTINQFLYEIFTEGVISVFGEATWRPFIHVEDACNMLIMAMEKNLTGVYNIGDESLNYTKQQIVDELVNYGLKFETKYTDFDDPRDYKVDFSKINSAIDYKIQFPIKDGISEVWEHLKKHH